MKRKVKEFVKDAVFYQNDNLIENPLISVILPTYCRGDNGLLERAIESVLNQSLRKFELIVVDDGSVDKTQEVVKEYLQKDNRIIYIRNEINSGLPAIRVNQGLIAARGKYICYQFDDDQWTNDALELLFNEIEQKNELCVVYGKSKIIDVLNDKEINLTNEKFAYYKLFNGNYIANNSVIHHRDIIDKYGMYNPHLLLRRVCDWELWIRWGKNVRFYFLNKLVSLVNANVENSLGTTSSYMHDFNHSNIGHFQKHIPFPKNHLDFEVNDISYITSDKKYNTFLNEQILPWELKQSLSQDKYFFSNNFNEPLKIISTKSDYDSTISIMIENFVELLDFETEYFFIPEHLLTMNLIEDNSILILCRASQQTTLNLVKEIRRSKLNVAILYFIDDDLLNFYKLRKEFHYFSPGTVIYETITSLIQYSHKIIIFSKNLKDSVIDYNNKIDLMSTNILTKYIANEKKYIQEGKFKILFAGGDARKEELKEIIADLKKLLEIYGEKIEFHFWGYIPEELLELNRSNIYTKEYVSSYYSYLEDLSRNNYNLILSPLHYKSTKKAKSPIKFVESVVCGGIGIYSDQPVYQIIEDGVNGFLVKEGESWFVKIKQIIDLDIATKEKIYENAKKDVFAFFSTETHVNRFLYNIQIAKLLSKLGNEKILYVPHSAYIGGAENHLLRHALLMKNEGFDVEFLLPNAFENGAFDLKTILEDENIPIKFAEFENACDPKSLSNNFIQRAIAHSIEITELIKENNIGLIHSTTIIPAMRIVSDNLHIPYIASLYATEQETKASVNQLDYLPKYVHSDSLMFTNRWIKIINCYGSCNRSFIPEEFVRKEKKLFQKNVIKIAVSGTLQKRKRQLEAIKAVKLSKNNQKIELHFFGYDHFFPKYTKECKTEVIENKLENRVFFRGFVKDIAGQLIASDFDILLCASNWESFPQVIQEAALLEIPIVSVPVTGVPELIVDNLTGYLANGFEPNHIAEALDRCINDIHNDKVTKITNKAKSLIQNVSSRQFVLKNLAELYGFAINDTKKVKTNVNLDAQLAKNYFTQKEYFPNSTLNSLIPSKKIYKEKVYKIKIEKDSFSSISIIIGTHFKKCSGLISVNLKSENYQNYILRSASLKLENIIDNGWATFRFELIENTRDKDFVIELDIDYNNENFISIYEVGKPKQNRLQRIFNRLFHQGELYFQID